MTGEERKATDDLAEATAASPARRPGLREAIRGALADWWGRDRPRSAAQSPDQLAMDRTGMAAHRTLMAADRTLMAWVRTSLSLYSFGFTIYKVLEGFTGTGLVLPREATPRNVGLFLTGMGTVAMVMGTIEYVSSLRELNAQMNFRLARPSLIMALLMSGMGAVLFFSIITRVF